LIGEKGTGKTTYAAYLSNQLYRSSGGACYASFTTSISATEYDKFITLKKNNHLHLSGYQNIWKVVLLLLISGYIVDNHEKKWWELFDKFDKLKKIIDEFYSKAFSPEMLTAISFVEDTKLSVDITNKYLKSSYAQDNNEKYTRNSYQTDLLRLEQAFKDGIKSLKLDKNFILFVDGIDVRPETIPYDDYLECVKGLANAMWSLNHDFFANIKDSKGRIKIVLLLRPDIFNSLNLQNSSSKLNDNAIEFNWQTTYQEYRTSQLFNYKDDVSKRIFFRRSAYSKYNFFIDSPLKLFLINNDWIPSASGKLIKPTEIYFLEKSLRDRYPNLIGLENISPNVEIKEGMRAFLVTLGAHEVQKETELSYDIVLRYLDKDVKQLNSYLKNFWGLLTPNSYVGIDLPQILPVRDSKGKRCFADRNNTKIYIADRTKRENENLRDFYSPCLDIDLDTFDKLSDLNQSLFIKYSSLPDEYIYNNGQNEKLQMFPLIEFADGLLAFAILLFYNKNKKSVLNEIRRLQLIKVKSITQKIGGIAQEIPHCFQNNAIAASENDWEWGIAEELHGWKSHINSACIEKILDHIDKITLSEIITFLQGRQVDFDDDDVAEAKELLWGFDKAKKLALQFIPSVRELEDEFAEYNSWEDIESKSLLLDLETLKEFFNSTLPLVQRGKVLAKDYEIDLREWNTACEELGEGCYVNKEFGAEFNKLRSKKQDFFLTCLLSETAWKANNHFLYNALQEWNDFDASDYADKFWQVDDDAFEKIINGFISQKYAAAEQENAVDKPYTIFQKNLEAWEAMGENADIDIYSNDYFLKEYPAEHFEIPTEEPEEAIVEAEAEADVEEIKSTVVPTVSAEKTPSAQVQSAHKVSIDSESVRSRVVKSTNERENHPTVRSVSPTSSEREGATASTAASQEKDISEIVNWKKLEVKFTAYKDITTANGGSNTSAPHSQRNYSPSDSVSETENLSDRDKAYIGKHGEECLFAYLNASFDNVKWVSTNNSQGIPGDDSLGYDFEIIDGDGKSQYIECKTTTGTTGTAEIHLGPTELSKAQECLPTENYSVYRVFPHGDQLQIVDLGNPLAEGNSVISFCGLKFRWRKK